MARCSLWGNRLNQWRRAQLSAKQLVCSSSSSVVDPLGLPLEGGGSQGMECEEWKPSVLPISRLTTRDRKKRRHRCPRSVTFSTFSFAVRVQVRVRLQVRILYWTCTNAWIERSVGKQTCAIQVNRAGYFCTYQLGVLAHLRFTSSSRPRRSHRKLMIMASSASTNAVINFFFSFVMMKKPIGNRRIVNSAV